MMMKDTMVSLNKQKIGGEREREWKKWKVSVNEQMMKFAKLN
jgi:hypothetical protein